MEQVDLTYADRQLFPSRIPRWVRVAPVFVCLAVLLLPPVLTFGYHFVVRWEIFLRSTYSGILGVLVGVVSLSALVVVAFSLREKQKRVASLLFLLLNVPSVLMLVYLVPHSSNWLAGPILEKRGLAIMRARNVATACLEYAQAHRDVEGAHYPAHLAVLIAGGKIAAEDLIDPFSSTTPMAVPAGLVEADWPTITAAVTAHSDFIYLGADWVLDRELQNRWSQMPLIYSPLGHFGAGPLVVTHGFSAEWTSAGDFATLWADANRRREQLMLPPLTLGGPVPTPPAPTTYLLPARPSDDQWNLNDLTFSPRVAALNNAILNYAVEHEGHFPPHLATLVARHDVAPADLLYPGTPTKALPTDLSMTTENDWPRLARDVEAHSDFVYLAGDLGDMTALESWRAGGKRGERDILLFYLKPLDHTLISVGCFFPSQTDILNRRFRFLDETLREALMRTNETRAHFGLPLVIPNIVPEYKVPTPAIVGAPVAADAAALRREVSRRNAMVIAAALQRMQTEMPLVRIDSLRIPSLLAGHYVLPRHLHDPDRQTALADLADERFPRFQHGSFPIPGDVLWSAAVDEYVQAQCDYVWANDDRVDGVSAKMLVYSKNDYGGTGRICGFSDGTAVFVPGFRVR